MRSKKILVNASPGSGNTFCKTLIAENLGVADVIIEMEFEIE